MTDKDIYVKAHYCIICKKAEICSEEDCDYREIMFAHGYCYGKLSPIERGKHDQVVEGGLPPDVKKAYDKSRRKIYMREYNRQWNINHPKYHNKYHHNNPEVVKPASLKYSKSKKGKEARKKYEDKSKEKKAKYMRGYMKEYREKQKDTNVLDPNNYKAIRSYINRGKQKRGSLNPLVNPFNPNRSTQSAFSRGLGIGLGKLPPTLKAQRSPADKRALQALANRVAQQRHIGMGFNEQQKKMSQAEKKAYLRNQMMRSFGSDPKDLRTNPQTDDKIMKLTAEINSLEIEIMTNNLSKYEKKMKKIQLDKMKLERKTLRARK